MAGPLVFCLALGGFLLLVSSQLATDRIPNNQNVSTFRVNYLLFFILERQSDFFVYIRYWCIRLFGILCPFIIDGHPIEGDNWRSCIRIGLLYPTNGRSVRY